MKIAKWFGLRTGSLKSFPRLLIMQEIKFEHDHFHSHFNDCSLLTCVTTLKEESDEK